MTCIKQPFRFVEVLIQDGLPKFIIIDTPFILNGVQRSRISGFVCPIFNIQLFFDHGYFVKNVRPVVGLVNQTICVKLRDHLATIYQTTKVVF